MTRVRIIETTYVGSAGKLSKLPEAGLPEVAFAGRSNVGKSSLLNALTNRKSLFKVGKTPGRTRTIVHVKTKLDSGAEIYLVDLPGYGYAKVAKGAARAWAELIESYLGDRPTLLLVVVLVDVRRGPEDEEADLVDYLNEVGVPVMLVATKCDRVPKSKRHAVLSKLKKDIGVPVLGTSATKKDGVDELLQRIVTACGYGG
jgi:GTP-binding protein